jgi:hypothetical protein
MFIERWVSYSALFTFLVGWHASAVTLPQGDIILAQLACPLNNVIFLFTSGIAKLSLYKYCGMVSYITFLFVNGGSKE